LKPDDLPANILPMIPSISALLSASDWTQSPRAALAAFHELASMQLPEALNDPVYEGKASLARPHDVVPSYSYIHQSATVHPGTCMVGNVIICAHCEIGPNAVLFGPTIVGPNSYIGPNAEVPCLLHRSFHYRTRGKYRSSLCHCRPEPEAAHSSSEAGR
jgi:UDP-3-O-[3-hydroxymyristoyl] glucosamine N-acyltransferase